MKQIPIVRGLWAWHLPDSDRPLIEDIVIYFRYHSRPTSENQDDDRSKDQMFYNAIRYSFYLCTSFDEHDFERHR